ncbi:MAG TPA: DmsC/YnfH family molybdoenzyme membrane anchor subunit [Casimicrobiaceae bacterium]|nr:DmsC/YnfH family molybdoenzyme membrane anchor subunit [Casimicrobiaceae bacterium]
MKPAFSIIFFTVGSGAGLGLLALAALLDLAQAGGVASPALWRSALLGLVLVAAGLASSTLHLANPRNAWRSLARVRTSWLSREAALSLALFPAAGLYIALEARGVAGAGRMLLALLTVLLSWGVLVCTAMIYASLKPIRQWHTLWTPVNYVLLGHWSGALLLAATAGAYGAAPPWLLMAAGGLGAIALAAKLAYWTAVGRGAPTTLAHAIGVDRGVRGPGASPAAQARLLDVGHSGGTFLTGEFLFVLARRHATLLRAVALVFGFALPLALLIAGLAGWHGVLALAACCMMGLLVERWLFFAEAKHTVRLFHGDART